MLNKTLFQKFMESDAFTIRQKAVALEAVWPFLREHDIRKYFPLERDAREILFSLSTDSIKIEFFNKLHAHFFYNFDSTDLLLFLDTFTDHDFISHSSFYEDCEIWHRSDLSSFLKNINIRNKLN